MPSATGQNWEKYQKKFADDEEEEKKIIPLSEEYVLSHFRWALGLDAQEMGWDGITIMIAVNVILTG